jgi:hypothetical protein
VEDRECYTFCKHVNTYGAGRGYRLIAFVEYVTYVCEESLHVYVCWPFWPIAYTCGKVKYSIPMLGAPMWYVLLLLWIIGSLQEWWLKEWTCSFNVFLELLWGLPTPTNDCTQKHPHLIVTGLNLGFFI